MPIIKQEPIPDNQSVNYTLLTKLFARLGIDVVKRAIQSNDYVLDSVGWKLPAEGQFLASRALFSADSDEAANTTGDALKVSQAGTSSIIGTSVVGCYLSNGGVWTDASSKKLKENFENIKVLDKLKHLKITKYNYISEGSGRKKKTKKPTPKHFTPMAGDFYKMFGLGDKHGLSPSDVAGVALQAIKELLVRIEKLESKLK